MKYLSILVLGVLWSSRIAAIKLAGNSGIPANVTVTFSVVGIAIIYFCVAFCLRIWPVYSWVAIRFYVVSGALGFVFPFSLEALVAPNIPVFSFVVIISSIPIMTMIATSLFGTEVMSPFQRLGIVIGFIASVIIAWDSSGGLSNGQAVNKLWVVAAIGVPCLYALNTLYVASYWPKSVEAIAVAQAQSTIIAFMLVFGSLMTNQLHDWHFAWQNVPIIVFIAISEALALVVFLQITRRFGANFVSLSNYVAIGFAAVLGYAIFNDPLTWTSTIAALFLAIAIRMSVHSQGAIREVDGRER